MIVHHPVDPKASSRRMSARPDPRADVAGLIWVKGGGRRQVDDTAGLPSAPEMLCAPRQYAWCQLPTSGEPPLTTAVEPSRSSSLSDGSCPHCGHCQEPVAGSQWGRHRGPQARLANPGIGVTSASRRRRSIDTFPPQEPRIPRALQSSVEPSRPPRCLRRCGNPRRFFARVAALNRRQAG